MSRFLQFLALSILMMRSATADPCTSAKSLAYIQERVVGYSGDNNIGDYRLPKAWYKLPPGYKLATTSKPCGTVFNWWTNDTLPSSGSGIINVCRNTYTDDCDQTRKINVTLCTVCTNEYYVYELEATNSNLDAYCIDETIMKPVISSHIKKYSDPDYNSLEFYCKLNKLNTELYYDFEWNLYSGASKLQSLRLVENVTFNNETDFLERTKLTEKHLEEKNITKPGFTIICTVKAGICNISTSNPMFVGVKISTQLPNRIEQQKTLEIQFKLTVPFGCFEGQDCTLGFHMVQGNKTATNRTSSNLVSHLVQHQSKDGRACGFELKNVSDTATFTVAAKIGVNQRTTHSRVYELLFTTNLRHPPHPFFESYVLPSIKVELKVDQQILQYKGCLSIADPHLKTFDGSWYEQHSNGTFILYRHKTLPAEVQTKTKKCANITGHCNCGVAVRAGRDIFQINNCDGTIPPRYVQCKNDVRQMNINRKNNIYTINLPHGTKVELKITPTGFINIYIYPSLADVNATEGLCGYFDNNTENDFTRRNGSIEKFDNDSWKVLDSEDLFNNQTHAANTSKEVSFCECSNFLPEFFANTACSKPRTYTKDTTCTYRKKKKKKRDVSVSYFDGYTDPTTAFKPTFVQNNAISGAAFHLEEHSRHKRQTTYTNETARAACLDMMNTTVFQMCKSLPDLDIDGYIDSCVLDAVISGSMKWTIEHLESIKQNCIYFVEVMQPLPQELLDLLVVLPDINSNDYDNGTYEYQPLPPQNESSVSDPITTELFQELLEMICSNECSGNGMCINGSCHCDEPYINFDCSINKTEPPIMLGIPDRGECDLQNRPCVETSVFGQNIAEIGTLTCRTTYFTIDRNNNINVGQSVDVPGYYESMNEIICPLPISTLERSVDQLDGVLAYGYQISFSNDGTAFSEADTIVIYDSLCVNCTKVGEDIVCTTKDGYCVTGGRCYVPGITLGCYTCSDDEWMAGQDCPSDDEILKGWMIGVICVSVVVVVIIIIIVTIVCLCGKSRRNKKIAVYMDSLDVNARDFNSCKRSINSNDF
ncbi:hypothetical protein ACF0H5_024546 [Mactra antiquata]